MNDVELTVRPFMMGDDKEMSIAAKRVFDRLMDESAGKRVRGDGE